MFGLLGLLVQLGASIAGGIENHQMKSYSYKYTDKGEPTWLDREGNQYINGERLVPKLERKPDGHLYTLQVGKDTGKVYVDPYQNGIDKVDGWSEERKQKAIQDGELAYRKYDHNWGKEITCEISTGRYIAELRGREDGTYWKYYAKNDLPEYRGQCYLSSEHRIDSPVQITQEEYDKLNIFMGSHYACDLNRYTYDNKCKLVWRGRPLVEKEDLPKVPGRN